MSMLPVPFGSAERDAVSSRQLAKARRAQEGTELVVFEHTLQAQALADMDRADTQAVTDATRTALEEEMDLLDYGLARTNGSAAKAELVARHVNRLAAINDRRLTRRFGG